MINSVMNIYKSEDIYGEALVQPLKKYHHFFVTKISDSRGLQKAAWIVAHIATGIFAYPILGILAAIGILIKFTSIPAIRRHNECEKRTITKLPSRIEEVEYYSVLCDHTVVQVGWRMVEVKKTAVKKNDLETPIKAAADEIDSYTARYEKVYVTTDGTIDENGQGEISISVRIKERIN